MKKIARKAVSRLPTDARALARGRARPSSSRGAHHQSVGILQCSPHVTPCGTWWVELPSICVIGCYAVRLLNCKGDGVPAGTSIPPWR